jgi:S-DNA-T family DNA segregation ATPase FtsK/SpoIIIE
LSFPLASLEGLPGGVAGQRAVAGGGWRQQLLLVVGAVAWLLLVIALASHDAGDPAFSTTGGGGAIRNKAGAAGAWFADLAFFLVGWSAWWLPIVTGRAWLGALAHWFRGQGGVASTAVGAHQAAVPSPERTLPAWTVWPGLALLLAASASLEWTRLWRFESGLPGATPVASWAGRSARRASTRSASSAPACSGSRCW